MSIPPLPAVKIAKEEPPSSESSATPTQSNYLTGQSPVIELPLHLPPRLVTVAFASTSNIFKDYFGGEQPSTPPTDTSDPRVFSRSHSSAFSSTHSLHTSDSVDVSSTQSESVMTSVIHSQSRDQIRKEVIQNYDFLIALRAAQKGSSEAQFNLGAMYQLGRGVEQDCTQAVYWYRKAAEQGDAGAQFSLGAMYTKGLGVKRDQTEAFNWYRKAAEQGHAGAQFNLGLMYEKGQGVEQDYAQAVNWYRKAAEQGNAGAQCNLGVMYAKGLGVKRDQTEAFNWYHKAAEQGDTVAQSNLGVMYQYGLSVKQDVAQAVNWYRKAADKSHANAQFNLGTMYAKGLGVEQDNAQAVYWFRKAAEQGDAGAQCNLGVMYEHGLGVEQDDAQAVYWFRKAAEQGDADAQFNLGTMYAKGRGVKQDDAQALIWYRKGAEQGDAGAQFQMGKMYAKGKGVEANDVEAFNWYLKAANNGSKDAHLKLASYYQEGLGVKKDVLQATYWLLRSVVQEQNREIFLDEDAVEDDFYSDVIQSIPKALTTFPEFKYIKTIDFRNIALRDQEFLSLGQLIRANPPLEGLNLEDQDLDDADALILAQSLAFNTTLTELIFDDEYDFDTTIFDEIKASLAQNVVIAELRERMKGHLITGPDGLPILVPYITRSDELPLEVLEIIVDKLILEASKAGKDKKAIIAGIDEFLLNVSSKTL